MTMRQLGSAVELHAGEVETGLMICALGVDGE